MPRQPRVIPGRGPEFRDAYERIQQVTALTSRLNVLPFDDLAARRALLGEILGRPVSDDVTIYPPFFTDHGRNIEFGGFAFVNQNCTFLDLGGIHVDDGAMIAPKVTLITVGHPTTRDERRTQIALAPIVIEENVWIGAAATVLPGVTIGRDAVIGAGAVVAHDVAPGTLVTGPAAGERRRVDPHVGMSTCHDGDARGS